MQPIKLPGAKNYGAPMNWDESKDGPCLALPVLFQDRVCTSVWTFSPEERARIGRGENLVLQIPGGQPPVMLSVADIRGSGAWEEVQPITPELPENWWQTFKRICFSTVRWPAASELHS
jgi:hypothetical protein